MKNSNSKFNEFVAQLNTENVLTEKQSTEVKGGAWSWDPNGA